MIRDGFTFPPTPAEERAQEIAAQKAIAAQLNAMVAQFKKDPAHG